jgi:lipopolysaccharide/colanic/teichoic acid biosynthesis glycosyltransferase
VRSYTILKRVIDCLASGLGILSLSAVFVGVGLAIKLFSPGPVFYLGRRVGLHGRVFRAMKFRSMIVDAEHQGGSATAEDDPRLTRLGSWLRKYKIDELPQLLNVFIGDMSLVGPRPEVEKYVALYTPEERQVLKLRPGITDWASLWNFDEGAVLAGSTDPERAYELIIRPTKLRLQLMYARDHSLKVDAAILFHTFMRLLLRNRWVPGPLKQYPGPFDMALTCDIDGRGGVPTSVDSIPCTPKELQPKNGRSSDVRALVRKRDSNDNPQGFST